MFARHSKLSWPEVQDLAKDFDQLIRDRWPRYYKELRGDVLCLAKKGDTGVVP
jgi:isopenicillin-N N-acyltransferase-like protein